MSDKLGFEISSVASVTVCLVCEVALTKANQCYEVMRLNKF